MQIERLKPPEIKMLVFFETYQKNHDCVLTVLG